MRFYNLVAILALGGVSAQVADDEGTRNLRGSEPDEVEIEGRDLVTAGAGSYSKSASVNMWQCWKGQTCRNTYEDCYAEAFSFACSEAGGSLSIAEAEFAADACCSAMAEAEACSFACVKAKGKIDMYATKASSTATTTAMNFELYAKLTSATMTIAKASSEAEAQALAAAGGGVFTGTWSNYCTGPGKRSYYCDPSGAQALADAWAGGYGDATALADAAAGSGTSTYVKGVIKATGSAIDKIYGLFCAVAKSFSWAEAHTQAVADANAIAFADAAAISLHCEKAYNDHCLCDTCVGNCRWTSKEEACSAAVAFGEAAAVSCGRAVAEAAAYSSAETMVALTYGGTLKNCKNDGKPLSLGWDGGAAEAEVGAALVCPTYD